ncbi:hypothetical protein [Devriesea agamarum]|uniref:hypothetical protein n=1 Tax=Devriesea agamarum TaxID=472569 RepID=UPI00071CE36A|nr:hypothetical protein [Devriesea agamarum]
MDEGSIPKAKHGTLTRRRLLASGSVSLACAISGCARNQSMPGAADMSVDPSPTADPSLSSAPSRSGSATAIPQDPLAHLDPALWVEGTADNMRKLPVTPHPTPIPAPGTPSPTDPQHPGLEDPALVSARDALTRFLSAAFLSPAQYMHKSWEDQRKLLIAYAPTTWAQELQSAWTQDNGYFFRTAFADAYAIVGSPRMCASWYVESTNPAANRLIFGGVIAYTVLNPARTRAGIYAVRVGASLPTSESAIGSSTKTMQAAVSGLDVCASKAHQGMVIPALADNPTDQRVQRLTMEHVINHPTVTPSDLDNRNSALNQGDPQTATFCP